MPIEYDMTPDTFIAAKAAAFNALAQANQGHSFDVTFMEENGGAYGISMIAIDENFNMAAMESYLYRPTSSGGHNLFRHREHIVEVLRATYSTLTPDKANAMNINLIMAASADFETIIIGPESLASRPKLLRAMNLKTLSGGPNDDVVLFKVRLCDGKGLGKSSPRLCNGKFKFLFPGVPIDTSLVKSRKRSRPDPTPTAPTVPTVPAVPTAPVDVKHQLRAIVKNEYMMSGDGRRVLHRVAYKFLVTLCGELDDATFDAKMGAYLNIEPAVLVGMFGSVTVCQTVAKAALDDESKVATVMHTVNDYCAELSSE